MSSLSKKEKEMMDLMEKIVHQYAFTRERPGIDICRKPEVKVVEILGKNGKMIMTEIAEQASLSLSTVTGIMDALVTKGLAQRGRSEEDRRIVHVELTSDGWKVYEELLEVRSSIVRGMLGALNRNEQDSLINLFRKIVHRIQKEKGAALRNRNNHTNTSTART